MSNVKLVYKDREYSLPLVEGSEGERAIDIANLRKDTGLITLDPGYGNTGACTSAITFIDGERGILRYRGYPIEEIADRARFTEVCYLLIYGQRPSVEELREFRRQMTLHTLIHEDMKKFYEGYPPSSHPMAIMAAMVASLSTFYPGDEDQLDLNIIRVLAKSKTLAAFAYKKVDWAAVRLPAQRPVLAGKFPANDVRSSGGRVRGAQGVRGCAEPALDPARRPRTKLLDFHDAHGGLQRGEPVCQHLGGDLRALGLRVTVAPISK